MVLPINQEQKMITRTKQDWTQGSTVKVGFLTLEVVDRVAAPLSYYQEAYRLWNPVNGKKYTFVPHNGIESGWVI